MPILWIILGVFALVAYHGILIGLVGKPHWTPLFWIVALPILCIWRLRPDRYARDVERISER